MPGKDKEKLKSFLGTESELQGELRMQGILRLDGNVRGKIYADEVILSETADIKGEIAAKRIIVGGKMEGILRAAELLEISKKGRVQGEIFANKLQILEGGAFNGQIEMKSDQANVLDFEARPQNISLKR
ncbi:MAG: polymer-forming cytoskeletal protein [Acidobacteria bacterium]|nr:polymer-forming cytoskeletal protein [Acidobacteriota bacterium]